jgi:endonuclease I
VGQLTLSTLARAAARLGVAIGAALMIGHGLPGPVALLTSTALADPGPAPRQIARAERQRVHDMIKGHRRLSDSELESVLAVADQDLVQHSHVLTLYLDGARRLGDHTDSGWEHEHLWPMSRGLDRNDVCNDPRNDAHHIFAEDPLYNRLRSDRPFGWCRANCALHPTENGANDNRREQSPPDGEGRWEVWLGRRGDVARALFYMDVRYEGGQLEDCEELDLVLTSQSPLPPPAGRRHFMGNLCTLIEWHRQDPVSGVDRRRNEIVFVSQENRNPFVDDPTLVNKIYGTCSFVPFPALSQSSILGPTP